MIKVIHRVNSLNQLNHINDDFGVEIDIHAYGDRIVVCHDALVDGIDLELWMSSCSSKFIIFNIKEEGIEEIVYDMAIQHKVNKFFLLDLSFPALIKMSRIGKSCLAVRVSEYESPRSALLLERQVEWVWLDCFCGFPLTVEEARMLNASSLKICLVSPELHGRKNFRDEIKKFQAIIRTQGLRMDAVCTKFPELW